MGRRLNSGARFEGKVALVTGGASGIGAAVYRRLVAERATVVVADVDGDRANSLAQSLCSDRSSAGHAIHLDVTDDDDWLRATELLQRRFGRLDLQHSNATWSVTAAAHELPEDDFDRQLAVNLKAAYLGVRRLVGLLRAARGTLVATSSVHGLIGLPGRPAYAAAKGGLCALVRQLAVEYDPEIRVNAVVPGPVLTPAWEPIGASEQRAQRRSHRPGPPRHTQTRSPPWWRILASADASYITGASILLVDGG